MQSCISLSGARHLSRLLKGGLLELVGHIGGGILLLLQLGLGRDLAVNTAVDDSGLLGSVSRTVVDLRGLLLQAGNFLLGLLDVLWK